MSANTVAQNTWPLKRQTIWAMTLGRWRSDPDSWTCSQFTGYCDLQRLCDVQWSIFEYPHFWRLVRSFLRQVTGKISRASRDALFKFVCDTSFEIPTPPGPLSSWPTTCHSARAITKRRASSSHLIQSCRVVLCLHPVLQRCHIRRRAVSENMDWCSYDLCVLQREALDEVQTYNGSDVSRHDHHDTLCSFRASSKEIALHWKTKWCKKRRYCATSKVSRQCRYSSQETRSIATFCITSTTSVTFDSPGLSGPLRASTRCIRSRRTCLFGLSASLPTTKQSTPSRHESTLPFSKWNPTHCVTTERRTTPCLRSKYEDDYEQTAQYNVSERKRVSSYESPCATPRRWQTDRSSKSHFQHYWHDQYWLLRRQTSVMTDRAQTIVRLWPWTGLVDTQTICRSAYPADRSVTRNCISTRRLDDYQDDLWNPFLSVQKSSWLSSPILTAWLVRITFLS